MTNYNIDFRACTKSSRSISNRGVRNARWREAPMDIEILPWFIFAIMSSVFKSTCPKSIAFSVSPLNKSWTSFYTASFADAKPDSFSHWSATIFFSLYSTKGYIVFLRDTILYVQTVSSALSSVKKQLKYTGLFMWWHLFFLTRSRVKMAIVSTSSVTCRAEEVTMFTVCWLGNISCPESVIFIICIQTRVMRGSNHCLFLYCFIDSIPANAETNACHIKNRRAQHKLVAYKPAWPWDD